MTSEEGSLTVTELPSLPTTGSFTVRWSLSLRCVSAVLRDTTTDETSLGLATPIFIRESVFCCGSTPVISGRAPQNRYGGL